jgi:hypothetical protein
MPFCQAKFPFPPCNLCFTFLLFDLDATSFFIHNLFPFTHTITNCNPKQVNHKKNTQHSLNEQGFLQINPSHIKRKGR